MKNHCVGEYVCDGDVHGVHVFERKREKLKKGYSCKLLRTNKNTNSLALIQSVV